MLCILHQLQLTNVGPAPSLELDLGGRLNLITVDKGWARRYWA